MSSYSHKDGILSITPMPGSPSIHLLQPFRILSCVKASFDPGGKASYGKQFAQTPYAILTGSAEPKLEIELSDATESWQARDWVGGLGAQPFSVSHVFRRLSLPAENFLFLGCCWENGGGYDSDDGSGVTGKISIKLKNCEHNGVSIYV